MRNASHHPKPSVKKSVLVVHTALAALSIFGVVSPAAAQSAPGVTEGAQPASVEQPAPAAAPAGPVQAVVVSASRIDRAGYSAPTPTVVIGQGTLEQRATVNVGDVLNEMPALRASSTPAGGGIGTAGAVRADLRGLTAVRTLVLLDRTRLPASNFPGTTVGGTTDLSIIPTALIRNVDVVTGGASAAYGSDAVAGVVNIVLDDKLDGVKGSVQGGQTRYNDARDRFLSLAGGTSFANGRGHVIAGAEYNDNSGTDVYNDKRAWGRRNNATFVVPNPRPAGVPANIIADNVLFGSVAPGGLITTAATNPAALRGLAFVQGAGATTTAPFQFGQFATPTGSLMVGGSNISNFQQLRAQTERASFLSRATFDLSDQVTAYAELLHARTDSANLSAQRRDGAGLGPALNFRADNYYLGRALTPAQLALVPAGGIAVGYLGNYFGAPVIGITSTTSRLMAGLRGKLAGGWKWDVSALQGKNDTDQQITNVSNNATFRNAIDAVQVSAANVDSSGLAIGSVVCRSTLTSPANGCSPLNILGAPSGSDAAYAYVFGTATARSVTKLDEVSANLQGEPFSTWAGPVSVGMGVERRSESLETSVDALSQAGSWAARAPAALPLSKISVKEVYGEIIVPLAKAVPFVKSLDLNAAVRRTDYSTSGAVTAWKGGLSWEPISGVRLRGSRSRDIRAPNLVELYTPTTAAVPIPTIVDPRTAFANRSYAVAATVGGNQALQPERSDTKTFGVVFQPASVKRLNLSADYYDIKVNGAIGSATAQTAVNSCLAGGAVNPVSAYCSLISYAGNDPVNGAITSIVGTQANVAQFRTHGVDMQLSYTQPLKDLNAALAGNLNVNVNGTRVFEYWTSTDVSALFPFGINRAGQTGAGFDGPAGLPKWMWSTNLGYRLKKLALNAQVRFISRGHQNNGLVGPDDPAYNAAAINSINTNIVPSMTYVNLGGSYDLGTDGRRELYFALDNAFDRAPPMPANNNAYYDLLGRTIKVGMRFSFD